MVHPPGYGPNYGWRENDDGHTISSPDLVSQSPSNQHRLQMMEQQRAHLVSP
jgi:hypothetical protein